MSSDFRFAIRTLVKSPGFTAIAVAVLALGIGANTAIFSAVNGVLLSPAGIFEPTRIVAVQVQYSKIGVNYFGMSAPSFEDIAHAADVFEAAGLAGSNPLHFTSGRIPQRLVVASVNPGWFDVFRVRPVLGRLFTEEENKPGNHNYAVLSWKLWRSLFGGDPEIVGKISYFNEQPFLILGVMPEGFAVPWRTEIWTPIALTVADFAAQERFQDRYLGAARLKPGVTIEQAQDRLTQLTGDIIRMEQRGQNPDGWSMYAKPFTDQIAGPLKLSLILLLFAAGFVLLIACSNVAGLQLARASSRTKEIAIRQALGARRGQIVRQLLVESQLLSGAGGLAGLALGSIGVHYLSGVDASSQLSQLRTVKLDWIVLAFTSTITIFVGVLFGIAPALQGSSAKPHEALKEGGRGGGGGASSQRFRAALVTVEIALALVLLSGTGLFLRSLARVRDVNPGFNPKGILTAQVVLPESKYKDENRKVAFVEGTLQKLSQAPGVVEAAAAAPVPFLWGVWFETLMIEGRTKPPNEPSPQVEKQCITPNYFHLMGIPLIRGRYFSGADRAGAVLTAIIDTKLAGLYFESEDPIGRRIKDTSGKDWLTIVGIVAPNRHQALETETAAFYVPLAQNAPSFPAFLVKTNGNPAALNNAMRQAVLDVDAAQPVYWIKTMEEAIEESLGARRTMVTLLLLFAGLALVLASLGVYGVISYGVARRTQEFGIRMALGATQLQVLGQVLRPAVLIVLAGVAAGFVAELFCGRLIASELYQVEPYDWITFVTATAILAFVAFGAAIVPAWRATKGDPMAALRYE